MPLGPTARAGASAGRARARGASGQGGGVSANEPLDLLRVSQYVAVTQGMGALPGAARRVRPRVRAESPARAAGAAAGGAASERLSPGGMVITTNYDDMLEVALAAAGEPYDVLSYIADGDDAGLFMHRHLEGAAAVVKIANEYRGLALRDRTVIVKLHGAVEQRRPIAGFLRGHRGRLHRVPHALGRLDAAAGDALRDVSQSHFLFLGYSLRDWNLRVILHRIWTRQRRAYHSWAVQLSRRARQRVLAGRKVEIRDVDIDVYVDGLIAASRPTSAERMSMATVARPVRPRPQRAHRDVSVSRAGPVLRRRRALLLRREGDCEIIAANLVASRLTILYAPSGVGKTSVLRAGVAHELEGLHDEGRPSSSSRWCGAGRSTRSARSTSRSRTRDVARGSTAPGRQPRLVDRLRAWSDASGATLLLIFDQFEEFLLYHHEAWRTRRARARGRRRAERPRPGGELPAQHAGGRARQARSLQGARAAPVRELPAARPARRRGWPRGDRRPDRRGTRATEDDPMQVDPESSTRSSTSSTASGWRRPRRRRRASRPARGHRGAVPAADDDAAVGARAGARLAAAHGRDARRGRDRLRDRPRPRRRAHEPHLAPPARRRRSGLPPARRPPRAPRSPARSTTSRPTPSSRASASKRCSPPSRRVTG